MRESLRWIWKFWARPDQIPPAWLWAVWFICAGRGWGKTRTGAEWVIQKAKDNPGCIIALVGRALEDVRYTMIEGESGILECCEPAFKPDWQPGNKRLVFPNGSRCHVYGAEKPDKLRGPQHHFAWCDEIAAWRFMTQTWDNLMKGLRLGVHKGVHNQVCVTTTPRPLTFLEEMKADPDTHVTGGSTFDNIRNLPKARLKKFLEMKDTSHMAQELFGVLLDRTVGAKWTMALIERCWVAKGPKTWQRVVVAVDPAEKPGADNDMTAIAVVVLGWDGIAYVVESYADHYSTKGWTDLVIDRARYWGADINIETNRGGDMAIESLSSALDRSNRSRGATWMPRCKSCTSIGSKGARSGPVSIKYEQGLVKHVGSFPELEGEQTTFVQGQPGHKSPNRMDANNIAISDLFELENFKDEETGRVNMTFKPVGL